MTALTLTPTMALFTQPHCYLDTSVEVAGWLTSARFSKRVGFLVLSDGSSTQTLQVVIPGTLLEQDPSLRQLGAGWSVRIEGRLVASQGAGQAYELQATSVLFKGAVAEPESYPIQPKAHTLEFLRTVPHLRPRVTRFGALARLRHVAAAAIHETLDAAGFLWVATPILTGGDAEGAGARFQVHTTPTSEDIPLASETTPPSFFGQPAYLTVSGQLEAEALCCALSRVYTFGPTFRAEHSYTTRHLAEFWMVEPEWAFATLDDLIGLAEGLLKAVVHACLTRCPQEMALFAEEGGPSLDYWTSFLETPFTRLTYTDAIQRLQAMEGFAQPVTWGMDLQSEHEKALVESVGTALAVTDYPEGIKAFYMKTSPDGLTVEAFDILVPGMGELVGGSVREEQLETLDARMMAMGMDPQAYGFYRDLRRYGTVPHGGFGIGFERVLAFISGARSVKDVIPYPRSPGSMVG